MNVKFHNTDVYLVPTDESKQAIPDGYQISIKLPPQKRKEVTWFEKVAYILSASLLVILAVNVMLSLFTGFTTVPLYSTVSSIQIASMLPLINITVPSNALSFYKILVTFIAFDFIPQANIGFTTQKAFSDKFALYGFDSINFVQNMGVFLGLVLTVLVIYSICVAVSVALGNKAPRANKIIRSTTAIQAWTKALFVMYIALMISSILAFKMWGIRDYWNGMDRLAVTAHLAGLVILYLFPLYVSWFVVYKSRPYVTMKAVEKFEKHSNLVPDELKT